MLKAIVSKTNKENKTTGPDLTSHGKCLAAHRSFAEPFSNSQPHQVLVNKLKTRKLFFRTYSRCLSFFSSLSQKAGERDEVRNDEVTACSDGEREGNGSREEPWDQQIWRLSREHQFQDGQTLRVQH